MMALRVESPVKLLSQKAIVKIKCGFKQVNTFITTVQQSRFLYIQLFTCEEILYQSPLLQNILDQ